MPAENEILFRNREEIFADMAAEFRARVPDVYLGDDGNLKLFLDVFSSITESVYLAIQILSEDMFAHTANPVALDRHGAQFGIPRKLGTKAVGSLRFEAEGGTVIPVGAEVGYESPVGAEALYFLTTETGTVPNPGIPDAPTLADALVAGNLNGTFEYGLTYVTTAGETELGDESASIAVVNSKINLSGLSIGGPGTINRRIYRQKNGDGNWKFVAQIDNVVVTYQDNIADGVLGGNPPTDSTAERITLLAESEAPGEEYNVLANTITLIADVPDGVFGVTNPAAFVGGTEVEATEDFRTRLLDVIRNPHTGSPGDLKQWAEEVDGVESATIYENDNLGVATPGHATIRISAPGGLQPSADLLQDVYDAIKERNIANIAIHVAGFTATPTNVTVTVTPGTTYTVADVTPAVQKAITDYINSLNVGETFRVAAVVDAVYGLPGVIDVVVNSPASNQATGATSKRTVGVLTVS